MVQKRTLAVTQAGDIEPRPVRWLWEETHTVATPNTSPTVNRTPVIESWVKGHGPCTRAELVAGLAGQVGTSTIDRWIHEAGADGRLVPRYQGRQRLIVWKDQ